MALDWLYGPKAISYPPHATTLRSLSLNFETVLEIAARLEREFNHLDVIRTEHPHGLQGLSTEVPVDLAKLGGAASWERQGLVIRGRMDVPSGDPYGHGVVVMLRRDGPAQVNVHGYMDPGTPDSSLVTLTGATYASIVSDLAQKLNEEGTPRPIWKRHLYLLPWTAWVVLLASWLWVIFDERPTPAFIVFGSLVVLAFGVLVLRTSSAIAARHQLWFPGNRIREISRETLYQQRADRWANLKLAAITVPAGAIIGAVVSLLIK
jgi:hypothetical protein